MRHLELFAFIVLSLALYTGPGPHQRWFAKSLASILSPLHWPVLLLGVAVWAWTHGREEAALIVVVGFVWAAVSILQAPWRVRLLDDGLTVDYPVGSNTARSTTPGGRRPSVRTAQLRGPPRLRRDGPNVWGLGGHVGAPM